MRLRRGKAAAIRFGDGERREPGESTRVKFDVCDSDAICTAGHQPSVTSGDQVFSTTSELNGIYMYQLMQTLSRAGHG